MTEIGELTFCSCKGSFWCGGNEEADRLANLAVDEYGQRSIFRSIFDFKFSNLLYITGLTCF